MQTADRPARYDVTDAQTGKVVKTYRTRNPAQDYADRRDHEYGAVRYVVRPVWA